MRAENGGRSEKSGRRPGRAKSKKRRETERENRSLEIAETETANASAVVTRLTVNIGIIRMPVSRYLYHAARLCTPRYSDDCREQDILYGAQPPHFPHLKQPQGKQRDAVVRDG